MGIIERAINRIDEPTLIGFARQTAAFFRVDAMAGEVGVHLVHQPGFNRLIGAGYQVGFAFVLNLQVRLAHFQRHLASLPCPGGDHLQIGLHAASVNIHPPYCNRLHALLTGGVWKSCGKHSPQQWITSL
jgi:uncharacterized membrane protein